MTPEQQLRAFRADVIASTSKFTEKRSSLKDLFAFLSSAVALEKKTHIQPTPFANLAAAKAQCSDPNDTRLSKYAHALQRLVQCWGSPQAYPPRPINPDPLIDQVRTELARCKQFACNDATSFDGDINPAANRSVILDRAKKHGSPVSLPVPLSHSGQWDAGHLAAVHGAVYKQAGGECTSFGKAAAHVLATAAISGPRPRIELVAWESRTSVPVMREGMQVMREGRPYFKTNVVAHVFCVVNRPGGTDAVEVAGKSRQRLPPYEEWGHDCWVVDPWLASLGWEACYRLSDYPKKGFLDPVYLEMDSTNVPAVP
ncbi:hypothetical protein [Massilia sp. YMA4]|uniref:hypothetical protein n=1 Tax=Massilia sp. YMA4 TaxID=1593482 RepID=UPI0015843555|nr:hypothetical protein [Massilia sp. YMA4]